jgi:hemoglobin
VVVEYIRYTIGADEREAFEAAYARAAGPLAASPHCLAFELSRGVEEPEHYILRIEWDSLEGHMEGFRSSPEFRAFFAEIRPYVQAIDEMKHYERTAVAG